MNVIGKNETRCLLFLLEAHPHEADANSESQCVIVLYPKQRSLMVDAQDVESCRSAVRYKTDWLDTHCFDFFR